MPVLVPCRITPCPGLASAIGVVSLRRPIGEPVGLASPSTSTLRHSHATVSRPCPAGVPWKVVGPASLGRLPLAPYAPAGRGREPDRPIRTPPEPATKRQPRPLSPRVPQLRTHPPPPPDPASPKAPPLASPPHVPPTGCCAAVAVAGGPPKIEKLEKTKKN